MANTRFIKWKENIEQLALELLKLHKNLFFQMKRKRFFDEIEKLINNIDEYDNLMIIMGIAKIVAEARDAHTSVSLPITRSIPFEFYYFPYGVFIVAALLENKEFLNCRVTHLNRIAMEEVIYELKSRKSCLKI